MAEDEIDLNLGDINPGGSDNPSDEPETNTYYNNSSSVDDDDINITNSSAPIIMLFGPPTSGKSMTLIRLARYLRSIGYEVEPDERFKFDEAYKKRCQEFKRNLSTTEPVRGTALNGFLLVKVTKHAKTLCQILEAPGEHYFNPLKPEEISADDFRPYMTDIIRSRPNRKIWVFITEANWEVHKTTIDAYISRIKECKKHLIKENDRVIILFNKVDLISSLFQDGSLNTQAAETAMQDQYNELPTIFPNNNPVTSHWKPYTYKFVPFCTGYYPKSNSKTKYRQSEDSYPELLWKSLMKCIKG